MGRVLLVDDSPHAQRMGEQILRQEGFEVVTLTDGVTALKRLDDVDPDVVIADTDLPRHSGYDLCEFIKSQPRFRAVRVVLAPGVTDVLDEERAQRAGSDGVLRKPFEASTVLQLVRPLMERAVAERTSQLGPGTTVSVSLPVRPVLVSADPEVIRAAVTVALDAAMPALVEEVTRRVLIALGQAKNAGQ